MRLLIAGVGSCVAALLNAENIAAQPPLSAAPSAVAQPVATRELKNVVPASAAIEQFVMTPDSARTYYRLATGGVWMYERGTGASNKILDGVVWDLALSPAKDALAFTKIGDTPREQHVWVLPLSPATGLAAGKERRVSVHAGDVPTISPDGKRVAFARDDETGVGQTVVVVPIAGGAERVVAASQPSGVSNIRWAPDGKKIYFGVNPPVPFTCAESCLTGARESRPASTIRRIGANGGTVETLATVGAPAPGLSPDGKYIVFADSGSTRRLVVADADGKRLKTFSVAQPQVLVGWTGNSTLLTLASGPMRRVRAVSVPDGAPRLLLETADFIFTPMWSPDSRVVAMLHFGNGCELDLRNADGSAPRSILLTKTGGCGNVTWTSDQRTLVFTNYRGSNEKNAITAVDATTGQSRPVRTLADDNSQWVMDRDVIVLMETVRDGGGTRRIISQVELTGDAKVIREISLEGGATITLVDRNRVLITRPSSRELRVMSLANGEERMLASVAGNGAVRASLSTDREWAGYLSGTDNTKLTKLELIKLDGSARRTVNLSFSADPGSALLIAPGGAGAVVSERRVPGQPMSVYFVNANSSAASKVLSTVGQPADMALSPDGRTILYLVNEQSQPVISAVDISTIR